MADFPIVRFIIIRRRWQAEYADKVKHYATVGGEGKVKKVSYLSTQCIK